MPLNDNDKNKDHDSDSNDAGDSREEPVLDLASRLTQDHHQSLKLWLRMLSCTVKIENEIRSRLRATFGITLPRFDLMAQLERHPQGLRMGELSKRMMVTGGNITGITDQLEQEKLVVRVSDPKDGRAYSVKLTPAGRGLRHHGRRARRLDRRTAARPVRRRRKHRMIALLSQHEAAPERQRLGRKIRNPPCVTSRRSAATARQPRRAGQLSGQPFSV
jgi:DNA-binding MarR family transcriptional regulator